MKKVSFSILMAGVLALTVLGSCKKDNENTGKMVFKATVQQPNSDSKTSIQPDGSVLWSDDDAIKVYNGSEQATFGLIEGAGTQAASFGGDIEEAGTYYAAYPASAATISTGTDDNKVFTFTLPATQAVAETAGDFDKNVAFMVAASNTQNFAFKNVFGILAVTLKSSTYSGHVSRFVLSAKGAVNIWGTSCSVKLKDDGSIDSDSFNIPFEGGSRSLTLTCDVDLTSEAQTFYILVPPVTMTSGLCLRIYNDELTGDPEIYCLETSNPVTIGSNSGATFQNEGGQNIVVQPEAPQYVFSVSPTQKVTFSPANLQYTKSTSSWSFMPNEVMTVEADGNVGTNYTSDVVSLFTWGANGNNGILPYNTNSSFWQWTSEAGTDHLLTTGENGSDWSVKANAANLGGHDDWRMLTQAEWAYLLATENNTVVGRVNAKNLRKWRTINGVKGLVILPDGSTANIDGAWADLQAVGAVFLPAAGMRYNTTVAWQTSDPHGIYWASDYYNDNYQNQGPAAKCLSFQPSGVYPTNINNCKYASSVRLVRNAE